MDQVREQRDRTGDHEDGSLQEGGKPEHAQAAENRLDPFPRAEDRAIDEPVRMTVLVMARMAVVVVVLVVPAMGLRRKRAAHDAWPTVCE